MRDPENGTISICFDPNGVTDRNAFAAMHSGSSKNVDYPPLQKETSPKLGAQLAVLPMKDARSTTSLYLPLKFLLVCSGLDLLVYNLYIHQRERVLNNKN